MREKWTKRTIWTIGKKTIAVLLAAVTIAAATPLPAAAADAATVAVSETISNYYQSSENYVLDDWEELAAIAAAGEDLTDYQLPQTPASGSTAVITSLIKGKLTAAGSAAAAMVSGGTLSAAGYAYGDALNMIAIEAYNRTVIASDAVVYDKAAAVSTLLSYVETDGGFGWGAGGDPDTTGLALVALSKYTSDAGASYYDDVTEAIADARTYLHAAQQTNGGFYSSYSGNNSNSAAVVMWGLAAVGEDPSGAAWTTGGGVSIKDALLSFYVSGGGFDDTTASAINAYSTKEAVLALADADYLSTFTGSAAEYLSVEMQIVTADGTYTGKELTVTDADSVSDVAERALATSGAISTADYHCFINGTENSTADAYDISDGDEILLIDDSFTAVAYFKTSGTDELGVNTAEIAFGASQTLTLVQLSATGSAITGEATAMSGIPVDVDGDGYSDGYTSTSGGITISPVEATTYTVSALSGEYASYFPYAWTTYIPATTAILPAKVTMAEGASQSRTVSVQIEGISANIAYDNSVTVGNSGTKKLTVWDAVKEVLDDTAGVTYTWTGSYLSTINGVDYTSGGGWVYVLNGASVWTGMAAQPIANNDKIVLYYCNSSYDTVYPTVTSYLSGDGDVVVKILNGSTPVTGASIYWAAGTANAYTTTTGINGTAAVPKAKAGSGSYSLQIGKTGADGLPAIVRLAPDYTITVSASGTSNTGGGEEEELVYISVTGPSGTLLSKTSYDWYDGITARDLLEQTSLDVEGSSNYVSSIEGIAQFDYGSNSGWLFKVNGDESITISADNYELDVDDYVVWYYTRDYTTESSSGSSTETAGDSVEAEADATVTENKATGMATAALSGTALTEFNQELAAGDDEKGSVAVITVDVSAEAKGLALTIPQTAVTALGKTNNLSLRVETDLGTLTFDEKAVAAISGASGSKGITLSVTTADTGSLDETVKDLIGDRPVYDFTMTSGDSQISSFGAGSVQISIPYTLAADEDPKAVVVYYINDEGTLAAVRGAYNEKTGAVDFTVSHFSEYAVGYNKIAFSDVAPSAWYADAVTFLAAREITSGTTADRFTPDATLTRGQFIVMLMKAYGIEPLESTADNFADAGDTYYTGYLAAAKKLAISEGMGDNKFAPEQQISRQDMFTLLYRALDVLGETPDAAAEKTLSGYSDSTVISAYAKTAMEAFVAEGVVSGSAGKLNPTGLTTRAQMAQVLYSLLSE